jgi:hypothetical protein
VWWNVSWFLWQGGTVGKVVENDVVTQIHFDHGNDSKVVAVCSADFVVGDFVGGRLFGCGGRPDEWMD